MRSTLITAGSQLAFLGLLGYLSLLMGCGSRPVAKQPPPSPPPVVVDPPSTPSVGPTDAGPTDEPTEPATPLNILSDSPLDLVEQGRLYRAAMEKFDEGDLTFVIDARERLQNDELYRPLSEALGAMLATHDGDHEHAMHVAESLSTVPLTQTESFVVAAEVFRRQGHWADAIACYRNAVQRNPGHARAHRWLGVLHYDTGAMVLATEHFRAAAASDLTDYASLQRSGQIHHDYHGYESAAEDFRKALDRNPPKAASTRIRLRLADTLYSLGQYEDALATLDACESRPDVFALRAQIHFAADNDDQARDDAEAALESEPLNRIANLVMGQILSRDSLFTEAAEAFQKAVDAKPNDHMTQQLLGECLIENGQPQRGEEALRRAAKLKTLFEHVAELKIKAVDQPESVEIRMALGKAVEAWGRPQQAMRWYRAALGLDPKHSAAQAELDRLAELLQADE